MYTNNNRVLNETTMEVSLGKAEKNTELWALVSIGQRNVEKQTVETDHKYPEK